MNPPIPTTDLYKNEIDFTSLALQYPSFASKLKRNNRFDFTDPVSVSELTIALAHRDFGLRLELPSDRLCPGIPGRWRYVAFVVGLVEGTDVRFREGGNERREGEREVTVLDVGTGASCVFPLLGCRARKAWRFWGTEIDEVSRGWARANVKRNGLEGRIRIVDQDGRGEEEEEEGGEAGNEVGEDDDTVEEARVMDGPLIPRLDGTKIDVLMTNPPFYASEEQMAQQAKMKKRPPHSACTGAPVEMVTPGGEVGFVSRIIDESVLPHNRDRIQWFSAMVGHLSSLVTLVEKLKEVKCGNYVVTEFVQGQKTRRWGVAWSWWGYRPTNELARGTGSLEKKYLPMWTETEWEVKGDGLSRGSEVGRRVNEVMEELEEELEDEGDGDGLLRWQWKEKRMVGIGMAKEDCWSRKARRKRLMRRQGKVDTEMDEEESEEKEPQLVFKISVREESGIAERRGTVLHVRWLQGHDSVLFESFCGWLKRKVEER